MYCAHLYTCQRISEKLDAGSVTQCMIPLYHSTCRPPFIPPKEYVKRRLLAQWRSEWSTYKTLFFCVVVPFITNLCMLQMSRVLRLLELSHSSNNVNDGRPIPAHPSSGPLPSLGPPSPPLSSLSLHGAPLFFTPIYIYLHLFLFCFFLKIVKT